MCRLSDVERQCSGDLLAEVHAMNPQRSDCWHGWRNGSAGGGESLMLAALMASGGSIHTANGDEVSIERYVSAPGDLIVRVT